MPHHCLRLMGSMRAWAKHKQHLIGQLPSGLQKAARRGTPGCIHKPANPKRCRRTLDQGAQQGHDKDGSAQQKEEHWDGNLGRKRGRRLEPKHHPNTADFHLTSSTQSSILAVIPYPPSE